MGLLERLRSQPKWKHPDPAQRIEAVLELAGEELNVAREVARTDPDVRVRRTAVGRLTDPAVLAEIAAADADESVREEAARLLAETAAGKYEDIDEGVALAAFRALTDSKHVILVARSAYFPSVRAAALAAVSDVHALGSIARQADHADTRLAALARIADAAELTAVAARTEHKDVGLAALERLHDRDALEAIADRARNKLVARRARTIVRELEEADAAEIRERAERDAVVRDLEGLVRRGAWDRARDAVAELARRWAAVAPGGDEETRRRAEALLAEARAGLAAVERAEGERLRQQQELARLKAVALALCERVDALAPENVAALLDETRAEWLALSLSTEGFGDVRMRFERACRLALERQESWQAAIARGDVLDAVARQAEAAADVIALEDARQAWTLVMGRWRTLGAIQPAEQSFADRVARAEARLTARQAEADAARARELQDTLARVQAECDRLASVARAESSALADADRALREARALADNVPPLPTRRDRDEIARRLREIQAALVPRIQELREMSDWQRWANAGLLERLCAEMEAVSAVQAPPEIARRLRSLEDRWKQIGPAPRDRTEELWTRFKTARDAARTRCEDYLRAQAAERAGNLARKEALCARAEALADSTDWVPTAQALQQLQAEWKTIGPVSRGQEKVIWQRFRAACDRFFTRRHADLARRKQQWAANLARKEALCARAEELADSAEWDQAAAQLKRLQAEWRTVGPVRKNKSEALWQRFRGACDRFFQRYAERDQSEVAARVAGREGLCQQLETLVASAGAADAPSPRDAFARANDVWQRWTELDRSKPLPPAQALALRARLTTAYARAADAWPSSFRDTHLDPDANRRAMEELCAKVERLAGRDASADDTASSPAMRLAETLREALAANTIGGKVDESAKWRSAIGEVRSAQAAWQRMGPVASDVARPLAQRFERACRTFFKKGPHA